MIYSMTGFGSARAEAPNLSALVEIKSVNHRYLDVHIKIPDELGEATDTALTQLKQTRITEGQSLLADIDRRLATIDRHLQTILDHTKDFVEHYRQQLIARVTELAPQLVADSGHRLETEALLYAERSDIAEETTRLRSHLDQFAGLKKLEDEAGKRMDFILQEMNREATTILSKTSSINELV